MPTYKGNAGHLMQHWTLCEILEAAGRHTKGLNFIDAYAMAPLATEKDGIPGRGKDYLFDLAESRLPNLGDLAVAYGRAWHQLTSGHCPPRKGYPNSAAFVEQVWKGDFSMLLCEIDRATCQEIKPWLQRVDDLKQCKATELFCGNWRRRFEKGLPSPTKVKLADGALTLVLFDPNMYNRRRNVAKPRPEILYPEDMEMVAGKMESLKGDILIQLSTYSAMDNSQPAVTASVNSILVPKGFKLLAKVRIDGNMMSLVYARNVSWADELTDLPGRFVEWLRQLGYPGK